MRKTDRSGNGEAAAGTSHPAALVAGAAALVLDQHPELTPEQVKAPLMATVRPFERPLLRAGMPAHRPQGLPARRVEVDPVEWVLGGRVDRVAVAVVRRTEIVVEGRLASGVRRNPPAAAVERRTEGLGCPLRGRDASDIVGEEIALL